MLPPFRLANSIYAYLYMFIMLKRYILFYMFFFQQNIKIKEEGVLIYTEVMKRKEVLSI